jgi:hypothetical protein
MLCQESQGGAEALVGLFAEGADEHHCMEVAVGSGDHAHVDLHGFDVEVAVWMWGNLVKQ